MGTSALQIWRETLEQHAQDRGWARVWTLRGQRGGGDRAAHQRLRWLRSRAADDAWAELVADAALPQASLQQLRAHRAQVRLACDIAPAASRLNEVLAAPLGQDGLSPAACYAALCSAGDRRVQQGYLTRLLDGVSTAGGELQDVGVTAFGEYLAGGGLAPHEALVAQAERCLAETAAPADELLRYSARQAGATGRLELGALLHGLRAAGLDGTFPARERRLRVGQCFAGLGVARHAAARLRIEPDHRGLWAGQALPLAVPQDIRLLEASALCGPAGELALFTAAGVGLGVSLAQPELPFEARWPLADGPASVLGGLFAQWLPDRRFLQRYYGISGKTLEDCQRALATAAVFELRLACFGFLLGMAARAATAQGAGRASQGLAEDNAAEALGRVLGVEVPPRAAFLFVRLPHAAHGAVAGTLSALALHQALRDRYDEDYFRNPRFEEVLRGLAQRGNTLTTEALLAEHGVARADWYERVLQWCQGG